MILSENLKYLRNSAELTQKELAKQLGIGQSTIVGYERGEREATVSNLIKYAKYFDESLDVICGLERGIGRSHPMPQIPVLQADDKRLLDAYHELDPKLKGLLWDMLETWKRNSTASTSRKEDA